MCRKRAQLTPSTLMLRRGDFYNAPAFTSIDVHWLITTNRGDGEWQPTKLSLMKNRLRVNCSRSYSHHACPAPRFPILRSSSGSSKYAVSRNPSRREQGNNRWSSGTDATLSASAWKLSQFEKNSKTSRRRASLGLSIFCHTHWAIPVSCYL